MPLYHISSNLTQIKEKPFKLEREIQSLTESNLKELLGLEFVRTEFAVGTFRIDTLAYDPENKAFVIIEYKRDRNFSVIDQGYAYLSLMLNNKADFILEYNERMKKMMKRSDVEWSQSKVLFVAPQFTAYQMEAINFNDLPIELWEIKRYDNQILVFEQVRRPNAKESIKTISSANTTVADVNKEIIVYTEADHIGPAGADVSELYDLLKNRLLTLADDVVIKPKKQTIGFHLGKSSICDVVVQNRGLKVMVNVRKGELLDPFNKARDVSSVGHWGNGDYEVKLESEEELDNVVSLIKQALVKIYIN